MKLFAPGYVNENRQIFLDIAKVLSILFMVWVHAFEYTGVLEGVGKVVVASSYAEFVNEVLGGIFAAPVFMFCMGLGVAYSKRSTPQYLAQRGVNLFIQAWLLNVARNLPILVFFILFGIEEIKGYLFKELITIDILHLAGISFLLFAFLLTLKISARNIFIISIFLSIFSSFSFGFRMDEFLLVREVISLFVGVSGDNFLDAFPLFSWFIFIACGYYFADFLKRCADLNKLMSVIFVLSWTLFLPAFIYFYTKDKMVYSALEISFYHMGIFGAFHTLCGVFAFVSLCYFISKILPNFITALCVKISNNITLIYWLQWIFILWFLFVLKLNEFSGTIAALVVFILSVVLANTFGAKTAAKIEK